MTFIPRPLEDEHHPYFSLYIDLVPDGDVLDTLENQIEAVTKLFGGLNERQSLHRYEPGKWSPKEVLGHLTDTERLFTYRGLTFARGDRTDLPGMDEDAWVRGAAFDAVPLDHLVEEFGLVRRSAVALFRTFDEDVLARRGIANAHEMSVRTVPWTLAGHVAHHLGVVRERYLD